MTTGDDILQDAAAEDGKGTGGKDAVVRTVADYAKTILVTLLVALLLKSFVVEAFRIPSGSMENTLVIGDFVLVDKLAYGLRLPRAIPLTSIHLGAQILIPWGSVQRGDIVVFEYPGEVDLTDTDGRTHYVKRCMGLPGDTIRIHEGRVFVNGREMTSPPHGRASELSGDDGEYKRIRSIPGHRGYTEEEFGPVVVPKEGDIVQLNKETFDDWRAFILREGHRIHLGADDAVFVDGRPVTSYTVERDYFFMLGDNRHNSLDSRFWGFVPEDNLVGEALLVYWSWDPDVPMTHAVEKMESIRWERLGTLVR